MATDYETLLDKLKAKDLKVINIRVPNKCLALNFRK